jgi:hypothetical protein
MSISTAFYQRLVNDAELKTMLAQYNGIPAVFTASPVPDDASLPYVITAGQISDSTEIPAHSKTRVATQFIRDIRIYADQTGSMAQIEKIGLRVWEIFHQKPLTIEGWTAIETKASRPIIYPQDGVYGLYVTVSVTMQQN